MLGVANPIERLARTNSLRILRILVNNHIISILTILFDDYLIFKRTPCSCCDNDNSVQQILRVISKPMNKESIYTHVWFLTSKGILVPQELLSYMGHSVALSEGRSNVD